MKILKKSFITFFLLLLVIQIPIIVKAESQDINQAYEEYLHNNVLASSPLNNPIEISPRISQDSFSKTFTNSIRVNTYTRSSDSSPVNLSVMVTSTRSYVDAALFDANYNGPGVKILGVAKQLTAGQFNSVNWTQKELEGCTRFYLFLTTYIDASSTVSGAITY